MSVVKRMFGLMLLCLMLIYLSSCSDETTVVSPKEKMSKTIQMKVSPDTIDISSSPKPVRSPDPTTLIQFSIPTEAHIRLVVYDDGDILVATLVDQDLAPGVYDVSWSVYNLASGVYYFQLNVGTYVEIEKMLLIK